MLFPQKHPTWLRLNRADFQYLMNCLYHWGKRWDPEWIDLWLGQL